MSVYRLDPADFPSGTILQFTAENYLTSYFGDQAAWDEAEQAAKMTMPSMSGAAGSGKWQVQNAFARDQATVGFAMRFKWDQNCIDSGGYIANGGSAGHSPKLVILHEGTASCQGQEFTTVNPYFGGRMRFYTDCGNDSVLIALPPFNYEYQPGGDTSDWYNGTNPDNPLRVVFQADVWCTVVYEFTNMNVPGSERVEMWIYHEGGTIEPNAWIKVLDYPFSIHSGSKIKWINSFVVGLYSSYKNPSVPHTPWVAHFQDILLNPGSIRATYGVEAVGSSPDVYNIAAGTRHVYVGLTAPVTAPPWVETAIDAGWAVGEWLAVSGAAPTSGYGLSATNTLHDVNTTSDSAAVLDEAFIDSWCGAALCHGHRAHGSMVYGPGGSHNNYSKGTTYLWDIATRTWEEVAGQDSSGLNSDFGEYNSGRPVRNHSAWWPFYDSYRNEFAYPKGWGSPSSGSDQYPAPFGHGLDLDTYDAEGYSDALWRRYPELTGLTGSRGDLSGTSPSGQYRGLAQQCGCAWDESRNCAWMVTSHNSSSTSGIVAKYDSATNTWTQYAQQWSVFLYSAYAIDPIRDCLVMPTQNGGGSIVAMDLANPDVRYGSPTSTASLWTVTNTGSPPANWTQAGWEWSDALGGFVWYRWGDSSVDVKLAEYVSGGSFENGVQTDYTLNWTSLLAGTNGVTLPAQVSAGCNNQFRLAKWGAREIAFFCPRTDGPMYAFRVN